MIFLFSSYKNKCDILENYTMCYVKVDLMFTCATNSFVHMDTSCLQGLWWID